MVECVIEGQVVVCDEEGDDYCCASAISGIPVNQQLLLSVHQDIADLVRGGQEDCEDGGCEGCVFQEQYIVSKIIRELGADEFGFCFTDNDQYISDSFCSEEGCIFGCREGS